MRSFEDHHNFLKYLLRFGEFNHLLPTVDGSRKIKFYISTLQFPFCRHSFCQKCTYSLLFAEGKIGGEIRNKAQWANLIVKVIEWWLCDQVCNFKWIKFSRDRGSNQGVRKSRYSCGKVPRSGLIITIKCFLLDPFPFAIEPCVKCCYWVNFLIDWIFSTKLKQSAVIRSLNGWIFGLLMIWRWIYFFQVFSFKICH